MDKNIVWRVQRNLREDSSSCQWVLLDCDLELEFICFDAPFNSQCSFNMKLSEGHFLIFGLGTFFRQYCRNHILIIGHKILQPKISCSAQSSWLLHQMYCFCSWLNTCQAKVYIKTSLDEVNGVFAESSMTLQCQMFKSREVGATRKGACLEEMYLHPVHTSLRVHVASVLPEEP